MAKIWAVFPTTSLDFEAAAFFVRAEYEQEARDLLLDVVRKQLFKTRLGDGTARTTILEMEKTFADNRMVIISAAHAGLVGVGESVLEADLQVVNVTATVRMMIANLTLRDDADRPTLIKAVAEESHLAAAYRRHLPLLQEWLAT